MARPGPGFGYGAQSPPVQDPRNPFSPQAYPQGYHQPGREYGDAESDMGDPYGSTARLAGNTGFYDSEYLISKRSGLCTDSLRYLSFNTF